MTSQASSAARPSALFRAGNPRFTSVSTEDMERRVSEVVSQFLQVQNLALLFGAGTVFHLGSPQIRKVSLEKLTEMISNAGLVAPASAEDLMSSLIGDRKVDLERLLASLSSALVFAAATDADQIPLGDASHPIETVTTARSLINRALAHACDLPAAGFVGEPWSVHNEFFRRLLRSRRQDLPRSRVFTTNYDLAIEQSLDSAGISCLDGLVGSVERILRPESYMRDLYLVPRPGESRLLRVPELIYLYKLHGSIDWRVDPSALGTQVRQSKRGGDDDDALALIYPTPQKDNDALGYPYSDLLRLFAASLSQPETALLVSGYSFADDHINRLIFQALASNASLQFLVLEPFGVVDEAGSLVEPNDDGSTARRLAATKDARVTVLTGPLAEFKNFAEQVMPDPDEVSDSEESDTSRELAAALGVDSHETSN